MGNSKYGEKHCPAGIIPIVLGKGQRLTEKLHGFFQLRHFPEHTPQVGQRNSVVPGVLPLLHQIQRLPGTMGMMPAGI